MLSLRQHVIYGIVTYVLINACVVENFTLQLSNLWCCKCDQGIGTGHGHFITPRNTCFHTTLKHSSHYGKGHTSSWVLVKSFPDCNTLVSRNLRNLWFQLIDSSRVSTTSRSWCWCLQNIYIYIWTPLTKTIIYSSKTTKKYSLVY